MFGKLEFILGLLKITAVTATLAIMCVVNTTGMYGTSVVLKGVADHFRSS